MKYIPVLDTSNRPLMPCHPARARELLKQKRAIKRWYKGVFAIKLLDRKGGDTQEIAVGIDPGSKKEGFTVKSKHHTYLNIQADAVTWVKGHVKIRREMRRTRRNRNTPYRKPRFNRKKQTFLAPSTKARWQSKLRICWFLIKVFPISVFIVEDIKARTTGKKRWDRSFSPLQIGKKWFYKELKKLGEVKTKQGYETKELRDQLSLVKSSKKLSDLFDAHCVDSWVLANDQVGGHIKPDNTDILFMTPIKFHRRQLHRFQPNKRWGRPRYGGTMSLGFKKGSIVINEKYGICYVGGNCKGKLSIHSLETGKIITTIAKLEECQFLAYNTWKWRDVLISA